MTIRTKICCTTYKKICTYEKKAVSLQHEKVDNILNIYSSCLASSANTHNINLLHSGKFADVNLTQSKLAKSLHLKIGAKVIKKLNTNKLNYKIMTNLFWKKYFRKLSASYNVQFEQAHTKGEQFVAMTKDMQVFSGSCKNETIFIHKMDEYTSAEVLFYYKVLLIEGTTNKFWHFNYSKNGLLL